MNVNVFDHDITGFHTHRDKDTTEEANYNRLYISEKGGGELLLWLTEAQANALRRALDELYPLPPAASDDASLDAIDRYAEEHCEALDRCEPNEPHPPHALLGEQCNGNLCRGNGDCDAEDDGFECTREKGHAGDHIACALHSHNLHRWPQKMSDLGKFLFDTVNATNRALAKGGAL